MSAGRIPNNGTAAIQSTIVTTKGDILAATSASAISRLAVGTNGQVLTADSNEATGLKYATPATLTSGLTLVSRQSFSAVSTTTTTFDGVFTSTYAQYVIVIENMFSTTGSEAHLQFRVSGATQNTGAYFGALYGYATGTPPGLSTRNISSATYGQIAIMAGTTAISGLTMSLNVAQVGVSGRPQLFGFGLDSAANLQQNSGFYYNVTITADGFILKADSGNITGTVAVYGLAKV